MIPDPDKEPTISVERGGQLLGLGRSAAYEAARRGELPVLRFGRRLVVPTAAVLRLLGLDAPAPRPGSDAAQDA